MLWLRILRTQGDTLSEAAIMADEFVLTIVGHLVQLVLTTNDMSKSKFCFPPKTKSPVMSGNIRATVAEHSSKTGPLTRHGLLLL